VAVAATEGEPASAPLTRESSEVRRHEPLDAVFRRLELGPNERVASARALAAEIDLRRVLPGEEVEIGRDGDGALRQVVLRRDRSVSVVVDFPPEGEPETKTIRVEPDIWVRRIEGELKGSLYESFLAAGADANLCMRYADLLAWQVDFLTEPRPGDRFRVLVQELRMRGENLGFGKILAAEYDGRQAFARATRWTDGAGQLDWYDDEGKSVRRAFLKSPLNYRRISSRFSARRRHPILKTVRPHWGVDYAAPSGTPVSALGNGVVEFAGRKGGYGKYIEVRHSSTFTTCYGHLSRFGKGVRRGARVEQGQVIGYVGSTGLSTGPHLDFRVKRHGQFIDPLRLEAPPGRRLVGVELEVYENYRQRAFRLFDVFPDESMPLTDAWARVPVLPDRRPLLALAP
jgi:murein DD-endopeptidase MepM/ murein hydrolase activator NlpD